MRKMLRRGQGTIIMAEAADPTAYDIWICPECGEFHKGERTISAYCCRRNYYLARHEHAAESEGDDHADDWKDR